MQDRNNQLLESDDSPRYTIRVKGVLDESWSQWFDGMSAGHDSDGTTTITGRVVDQAALHRIIRKIRDLGLELISVQRSAQ